MAKNKTIFLDANVLLEIILDRPNNNVARRFINNNAGELQVSALTAHLVVHFGQPIVGLPVLKKFLQDYTVQDLTDADFNWAFLNARNTDFEDALQLAVAIRTGCDIFATFDNLLFKTYNNLPTVDVRLLK